MTRVILNGTIKGLRGKIGGLIFRQLPNGTTIVTSAPPKKTSRQEKRAKLKRSARQKAHNDRFEMATGYAKASQTNPVYLELAAVTPMNTAYNFALKDWFHAPVIHRVKRQGGQILVEATDNIMVARVRVTIRDEQGTEIESGEATHGRGNWWKFTPQTKGKSILAEAWDLPNHKTKFILE